jgi:hypothetical protein
MTAAAVVAAPCLGGLYDVDDLGATAGWDAGLQRRGYGERLALRDHHGAQAGGRFQPHVEITPDDDSERKPYWVPPCVFSAKYLGHGGTRFVTEAAYIEFRDQQTGELYRKLKAMGIEA